jgi:aerobic carbon-monoxide dehydrogenase medium subunit
VHPNPFEYHRAASVEEAISLLQTLEDPKLIAGGHSLLPAMKLRLANPANLVDITSVPGLSGVTDLGDTLEIGALTTHRGVAEDGLLKQFCPVLADTAEVVGDRQVRNRGTIGGALAHGDPAADYPAAILALDAELVAVGPNGQRTIAAADFFVGLLTTALEPEEILTAIRVPKAAAKTGMAYEKLANQASGYALVGVAAIVSGGAVRIGITGVGDHAFRANGVEAALAGKSLDEATVKAAAQSATDGVDIFGDLHASEAYRRRVTSGLVTRAILKAAARAGA